MNQNSWATQLLTLLGIPVTDASVAWITQWTNAESPWGTAVYGNPLNIQDSSIGYNPANTAAWLSQNGNFGGIGTYANNIATFLKGQASNIGQSLAWFSGHSGNTNLLTSSYQQLINGNYASDPNAGPGQSYLNWLKTPAANTPQAQANENATVGSSIFDPIVQGLETGGALIVAVMLIAVGGLWLVLSNKDTQTVIKEGAKAALVAP